MSVIIDVFGREVLDSRGNPTVEVEATGGVIFVGLPKFDKFPGFPACAWAVVPNED